MAKRTFIACAKTDCKWNTEGQCDKSEIYVDDGVVCASYEPDMMEMLGQMLGGMGAMGAPMGAPPGPDPRSMLVQQMASSGPPPLPGGMSQPALPGMEPSTGAPPPLRF